MTTRTATLLRSTADASAVLAKAALRAADCLALSQADLARVLGLSPATVSRLAHGQKRLEPPSKPFELAALFVRLFRSLDAIVGSDDAAARAWLPQRQSCVRRRAAGANPRSRRPGAHS